MAQTTQWLPAVLDYMKKGESNLSTSHPTHPCLTMCTMTRAMDTVKLLCLHNTVNTSIQ